MLQDIGGTSRRGVGSQGGDGPNPTPSGLTGGELPSTDPSTDDDPFYLTTMMMNREYMINRDSQNERAAADRLLFEQQRNIMMMRMYGNRRR